MTDVWHVHLATTPKPSPTTTRQPENNLMEYGTKPDMVQLYHTTLFTPVKHTLIRAINKDYFYTCPNLTIDIINKHLPPLMATAKGHMYQKRKNINSTKQQDPMR